MEDSMMVISSKNKNGAPSMPRIVWIDVCKGITMILVVLGHIKGIPSFLSWLIFSFHMPLFFLINGYLIRHYRIKDTFIRSSKTLVRPYCIICIIQAIIAGWFTSDFSAAGDKIFSCLNDMIIGMSKISTAFKAYKSVWLVWFLICLFAARVLYVLIRNLPGGRTIQNLVIIAVSAIGCYIGKNIAFLPWSLDVSLAAISFVAAGDMLSHCELSYKKKILATVVALGVWILLVSQGAHLELAMRKYPMGTVCFICAIAGCWVIMMISQGIDRIPVLSDVIAWIGKNSIVILAVHCLEMRFFQWDQWIYQPLGIMPGWQLSFIIHMGLILLVSCSFIYLKKGIKILTDRLREKEKIDPKRLDWPDIAKGICIISVIIGHLNVSWINQIVFMYHLPVFFLLAGYFLKKREGEWVFIRKKAKRLLIPYVVTSVLICVIAGVQAFIAGNSVWKAVKAWIKAALYGAGDNWTKPFQIKGIGAIWFLLALFLALLIVHFFVEKKHYKEIIAGIAFIGWLSFDQTKIWLPLSIQAGMLASLYILIGYEARKGNFSVQKTNTSLQIVMFLIMVFSIQYFKAFWLVHNRLGNGWIDLLGSLAASVIVIAISKHISQFSVILKRVLQFFGKNSLVILCAHLIELNVLKLKPISNSLSSMISLNNNHSMLLLIILKIIFVVLAVVLTNKCKDLYRVSIGALRK